MHLMHVLFIDVWYTYIGYGTVNNLQFNSIDNEVQNIKYRACETKYIDPTSSFIACSVVEI